MVKNASYWQWPLMALLFLPAMHWGYFLPDGYLTVLSVPQIAWGSLSFMGLGLFFVGTKNSEFLGGTALYIGAGLALIGGEGLALWLDYDTLGGVFLLFLTLLWLYSVTLEKIRWGQSLLLFFLVPMCLFLPGVVDIFPATDAYNATEQLEFFKVTLWFSLMALWHYQRLLWKTNPWIYKTGTVLLAATVSSYAYLFWNIHCEAVAVVGWVLSVAWMVGGFWKKANSFNQWLEVFTPYVVLAWWIVSEQVS